MFSKEPIPAIEVKVNSPSLADALDLEMAKDKKMKEIRMKYGKPEPETKQAPNPIQWIGDNRS